MGWFALTQHYSAPTRKLDWTLSQWVALNFACCEEYSSDATLWIANFDKVNSKYEKYHDTFPDLIGNPKAPEVIVFASPLITNERIEAQQGSFSVVASNILCDHETLFKGCNALVKIIIPKIKK